MIEQKIETRLEKFQTEDRPEPPVRLTPPPKRKSMHRTIIQLNEGSEGTVAQQVKSLIKSKDLAEAKIIKSDKYLIIGSNTREQQKEGMSKLAKNQAYKENVIIQGPGDIMRWTLKKGPLYLDLSSTSRKKSMSQFVFNVVGSDSQSTTAAIRSGKDCGKFVF